MLRNMCLIALMLADLSMFVRHWEDGASTRSNGHWQREHTCGSSAKQKVASMEELDDLLACHSNFGLTSLIRREC